jgi:hypothetical protein
VTRWFDRTFESGRPIADAPVLFARLRATPDRLESAVAGVPRAQCVFRPDGRWSIQEHAGHLLDLEPLLERRLDDFDAGAAVLTAADLQNRKTDDAHHNDRMLGDVTGEFRRVRAALVDRLARLTGAELARRAVHPRLQQSMTIVDLCFFVAEHDDHHLQAIATIASRVSAMPSYAIELVNDVERAVPRLLAMDDAATLVRPGQGKWSPREIVGHLVDSAANNHQRFVRAQFQEDLVFAGYAQDEWVAVQRYQEAPWADLVTLWASYNRHLARVMAAVPQEARLRSYARHNFDRLAYQAVPAGTPSTLDYFMNDYVRHLEHHLRQLGVF